MTHAAPSPLINAACFAPRRARVLALLLLSMWANCAAPLALAQTPFGIKAEGITSPEMRDALNRLQDAGVVAGRRGSLTFFRWSDTQPPQLKHLGLWGPKVTDDSIALVAHLPDLEFVSLYETNVTDRGLAALAKLKHLRNFAVTPITRYEKAGYGPPQWSYPFMERRTDRQPITGQALTALAATSTLEGLDLLDVKLSSRDLALLSSWPKLSALSLPNKIDDETVGHLQSCRRLNSLTLGHREITADELRALASWKSLRKLKLIHATVSDQTLGAFAELATLQELVLEDCGLTDERLVHLRTAPALSQLILERNEIAGPGLAHLVKLKLKTLGLEFNNITDDTLRHLPQLTTLENLWLAYCRGVTDDGIRSGTLQSMTQLKQLRLRGLPKVTDASLDEMVRFAHLEHITIRETKISAAGVARMKRDMPKTTVFK